MRTYDQIKTICDNLEQRCKETENFLDNLKLEGKAGSYQYHAGMTFYRDTQIQLNALLWAIEEHNESHSD